MWKLLSLSIYAIILTVFAFMLGLNFYAETKDHEITKDRLSQEVSLSTMRQHQINTLNDSITDLNLMLIGMTDIYYSQGILISKIDSIITYDTHIKCAIRIKIIQLLNPDLIIKE